MLEMRKNTLDKGGHVCAMFMDLSIAFGTLNHNSVIAKSKAYGFEKGSLQFMKCYLNYKQLRVYLNKCFSSRENITAGVPQSSTWNTVSQHLC